MKSGLPELPAPRKDPGAKKPADKKVAGEGRGEGPVRQHDPADRNWTDSTSQYHVVARFVARVDDGKVRLLRADGCYVRVAFDRLSTADQSYVLQQDRAVAMK